MKKLSGKGKCLAVVLGCLMTAAQLAGCTQADKPQDGAQAQQAGQENGQEPRLAQTGYADSFENCRSYLSTYFGVDADTSWDSSTFSAALSAVAGEEAVAVEGELTSLSAMKAVVASAAYDELAKSYPEEKVQKRLLAFGITGEVDTQTAAYLACGLDTAILREAEVQAAVDGGALSKEYAAELLMTVADANGNARNFLGYSNDPQIYARLDNMWNSFLMFDDPELTEIGRTAVENGITTGYNLKNDMFSARFLPELTIQYGHSDIKHAHQLLGLLSSEDIVAKVQLEPKVSVFQRLLEWGPIEDEVNTPTYEVRKYSEELYLTFAVEYDLQLEFETLEDLMRFDEIIHTYAKKNEGNEDAVGMIYGAWWQPLYTTTRTDMPSDAYYKIQDCVIKNGVYSIHPFCLDEKFEETEEHLNAINSKFQVEAVTLYCDKPFYNYMAGDDYQ